MIPGSEHAPGMKNDHESRIYTIAVFFYYYLSSRIKKDENEISVELKLLTLFDQTSKSDHHSTIPTKITRWTAGI